MDRQGNRVRFTRLSIALVCLACVCLFGVFAVQSWWKRVTTDDSIAPVSVGNDETAPIDNTDSALTNQATQNANPDIADKQDDQVTNVQGESNQDLRSADALEQPPEGTHPLDEVLDLARRALVHHRENHWDYTAKLSKTERINNRLLPTTVMDMKLRYRPLEPGETIRGTDLYFRFLEPRAQAGREVIYAPLKYNGKIKAHEGGFLGIVTVELTPNSQLAMRGNRHPITEAGLEKLIVKLIDKGERDRARGDCIVNRIPDAQINNTPCELVEVIHANRTYEVNGVEYPHEFFKAKIWFDMSHLIPIKYASYLWPEGEEKEPLLEEEYIYDDIKLNQGLTDLDFDIENKKYAFP